jgi:16S rRNA (uracil1498-N3)-methyltransferase
VIEACKQCGRDALMQIGGPKSIAEVVGDAGSGTVLLVADRDGIPLEEIATEGNLVVALVGPEGGLTEGEIATVEAAGARRVSLGPHVLRVETAAIALAARLA